MISALRKELIFFKSVSPNWTRGCLFLQEDICIISPIAALISSVKVVDAKGIRVLSDLDKHDLGDVMEE